MRRAPRRQGPGRRRAARLGALNGFATIIVITAFQPWAPPRNCSSKKAGSTPREIQDAVVTFACRIERSSGPVREVRKRPGCTRYSGPVSGSLAESLSSEWLGMAQVLGHMGSGIPSAWRRRGRGLAAMVPLAPVSDLPAWVPVLPARAGCPGGWWVPLSQATAGVSPARRAAATPRNPRSIAAHR